MHWEVYSLSRWLNTRQRKFLQVLLLRQHPLLLWVQLKSKTPYYICLALAIFIGAGSGLYDKYMMRHFDHNAVQVYYTIYQTVIMVVALLITRMKGYIRKRKQVVHTDYTPTTSFHWTWAIAGISVFLVLSDYVYMLALSNPDSLISVVSTIRRGGTLIAFLYGLIVLKEKSPARNWLACLVSFSVYSASLSAVVNRMPTQTESQHWRDCSAEILRYHSLYP